jgi:hypothetical protein
VLVFWVITQCGIVGRYQCFRGTLVSTYKSTWHYNPGKQQWHVHNPENNRSHKWLLVIMKTFLVLMYFSKHLLNWQIFQSELVVFHIAAYVRIWDVLDVGLLCICASLVCISVQWFSVIWNLLNSISVWNYRRLLVQDSHPSHVHCCWLLKLNDCK